MANEIDPERVEVGMRLKAAREAAGLSQQAVADRFGKNKATVSAWETGRGDPGIYQLRDLAKYYKISVAQLLQDNSPQDEVKSISQLTGLEAQLVMLFRGLPDDTKRDALLIDVNHAYNRTTPGKPSTADPFGGATPPAAPKAAKPAAKAPKAPAAKPPATKKPKQHA